MRTLSNLPNFPQPLKIAGRGKDKGKRKRPAPGLTRNRLPLPPEQKAIKRMCLSLPCDIADWKAAVKRFGSERLVRAALQKALWNLTKEGGRV